MATAEARLHYNFRATDHSDPQRRVGCHGTVSRNPGDGDHHAAIAQGNKKEALKP
ncbi:MAG TPA: hypothetical protein VFK50_05940 [Sphingomicrobium sp.]|nr:hypothetical protein [Sphingomicrobium sp.]